MSDEHLQREVGSVTIRRVLTAADGEFGDLVVVDVSGDLSLVEQLGMLRLAEDTLLTPDTAGWGDEEG